MALSPMEATPSPTLVTTSLSDTIDPIASDWRSLAAACGNAFATPDWASAWLGAFGGPATLRIASARDAAGRVRVVVPLVLSRRGTVRVVRFVGHGVGDMLGPVAGPEDAALAHDVLAGALESLEPSWDVFVGERLPVAGGWASRPDVRVLRRESNPVLHLCDWPDWEAYLAARPRRLRRELRHDERVLATRHDLRIRRTTDPATLDADLDAVFRLHAARFGDRSSFAPRERFYRRFAARALERDWLRLWILEADGQPVAARYDLSIGGVYHAYNGGRHPDYARYSVGLVLRAQTIRAAYEEGATTYRFLRGGEPYKARFGTVDDDLVTVARARTWRGRRAIDVAERLRHPRLRRLVRRTIHTTEGAVREPRDA